MPSARFEHTPEMARRMLASLWERSVPVVRERIAELEAAAQSAADRSLTPEAREAAAGTAHKLAGSLGMFGYSQGTDAARRLEQQLEGSNTLNSASLQADVAALRAALPL